MTFVRNERFPAYVFRDSGCFELSVQLYTCFRSRTSEALPLYMFPNYPRVFPIYFRGGICTICFRGFAFVHLFSQRNLNYLLPRLCLRSFSNTVFWTLTLSRKQNNSELQFLRNKTIACNQNTVKAILFLVQLWLTIFSCFDLCAVRFRSVLRLCWFDLNLSVTCLQCP